MTTLKLWFAKNAIMAALIAAVAVTGLLWDRGRIKRAESRGATAEKAKTERANVKVVGRADRVRSGVKSGRMRGSVDPNYID